jgi:hypothetical protein
MKQLQRNQHTMAQAEARQPNWVAALKAAQKKFPTRGWFAVGLCST